MPGYLGGGGGSASGGVGGEIKFPKEFIDPVTKLRVSNPQNLIDTDFEYGLQPTKWETVELINNTPSFFSKSGDTTIDGIQSITTNAGTREVTVRTELEHGLAVGIPINVQGTKSTTAEGSYIINSIPDEFTFTYLAKDTQAETASINDLYSSIITGEFFQGSQLRISSIVTDAASPISELTVTTQSTHGFGPSTPFYFLNLNSTIAQEFPASNTETRSFDSSNSATAQTFDGSNTLSSINIDLSNSATEGGFASTVTSGVDPNSDTIEVAHPAQENFAGLKVGQALYYDVQAGSGFFQANPRGVVFLLTTDSLGTGSSIFQVSEIPNGTPINITGAMTGTFQIANQARTFAGNNINPETEVTLGIVEDAPQLFDGANENGSVAINPQFDGTNQFSVVTQSGQPDLDWTFNTMVRFDTDGTVPTGLTNGETYFINQKIQNGSTNQYFIRLSELPSQPPITIGNDGSGTMTLTSIGVSLTKDIIHLPNHGYQSFDMVRYSYPEGGRFGADEIKNFYFVQTVYDSNNFSLTHTLGEITPEFQSFGPFDYGTQAITSSINIVGFEAPYSFSVTQGVLPQGLSLDPSTGVISGTPQEVYDGQVVITMTDANGSTDTQTIAFEFTQPPNLYNFTSVTFTPGGSTGSGGPSTNEARAGAGNPSWASSYINTSNGQILWTVPETATYRFDLAGAEGDQRPNTVGGRRGTVVSNAQVSLTQGQVIRLVVGQRGTTTAGGFGGGGNGGSPSGGGGGGASDVRTGSSLSNRVAVAGGGGGDQGGSWGSHAGGGGISSAYKNSPSSASSGSLVGFGGQAGYGSCGSSGNSGGLNGGRPSAYGDGGGGGGLISAGRHTTNGSDDSTSATDGGFGFGGTGGRGRRYSGGGGGGGGWYGGGGGQQGSGGCAAGGGAGSSMVDSNFFNTANVSFSTGSRSGDGYITVQKL